MRVIPFLILSVTYFAVPAEAWAQGACGRALMMAGPDLNGPAEVVQKRMLERECELERADDRARQQLAQKRIEARSSWNAVRPEIKACINATLEIDGRNIDQLINLGVSASDDAISPYRRECFGLAPDRDGGRVMNTPGGGLTALPSGGGGVQRTRDMNLLAAVNPLTGTRKLWDAFKDEGGLATFTDFHGLRINKATVNLDGDRVDVTRLQVPAAIPPRKIREALNDACRGREQDWKAVTDTRGTRGELITPQIICRYETDDGASDYEIVMQKRK